MRASLLCILLAALLAWIWIHGNPAAIPVASKSRTQTVQADSPEVIEMPVAVPTPPDPGEALADDVSGPVTLAAIASLATHSAALDQSCLAGTGGRKSEGNTTIHRWTDAAGIVHFSDQAPGSGATGHRRIEVGGLPPVRVEALGVDVNLPDFVVQRATMDAEAIERVLRNSLGVIGDPGLALTIEFIASAEIYARRIGDAAMANSDGTYSSRDRTIRIRQKDDAELNFRILRHEMTHALVHEHIGHLPTSINEGLAGFFEHIEVAGMGARVTPDAARRQADASMSEDGQDELVDLLAREAIGFYGAGQENRYLRSMALIALLMDRVEGRAALAAVLSAQQAQPCVPVESARILDHAYPGGLVALARDWSLWLRNPEDRLLSY